MRPDGSFVPPERGSVVGAMVVVVRALLPSSQKDPIGRQRGRESGVVDLSSGVRPSENCEWGSCTGVNRRSLCVLPTKNL